MSAAQDFGVACWLFETVDRWWLGLSGDFQELDPDDELLWQLDGLDGLGVDDRR